MTADSAIPAKSLAHGESEIRARKVAEGRIPETGASLRSCSVFDQAARERTWPACSCPNRFGRRAPALRHAECRSAHLARPAFPPTLRKDVRKAAFGFAKRRT